MADESAIYELSTPVGSIFFNNGDLRTDDDLYWISEIEGLDGATIRAQVDNAPQTHGGIVHTFWKAARQVTMQGAIVVQSIPFGSYCLPVRNEMEQDLRVALESIIQADGQLSWTPAGGSGQSLTVRHNIRLDFTPQESYAIKGFVFGLVAADPDF